MAKLSISLLAFLLLASYASATSIQELCKGNPDVAYCVSLLKSSVHQSSDFKSQEWRKKLVNHVLLRAVATWSLLADGSRKLKGSDAAALKVCVKSFGDSVNNIHAGHLDMAVSNQDNCSDAMEDGDIKIRGASVKELANEAAKDTQMAYRIFAKLDRFH